MNGKSITRTIWLLVWFGLGAAGSAHAVVHDVTIGNNFFSPRNTVVQPGDVVRWTWVGGISHSTTSDASSPKSWNSIITSQSGFVFQVLFSESDGPGPFPYHCAVHFLTMKDTIHIVLPPQTCCDGTTVGNVDCLGIIDIGDVTVMIQKLFITIDEFCCEDEADIDSSGLIDIGDLTIMISSLFITLAPMPDCPG